MATLDLSRVLYSGTRPLTLCTSLNVGRRGAPGQYLSNAHKTTVKTVTSANNAAKISYAAIALEYILTGRLAALENTATDGIYIELHTSTKVLQANLTDVTTSKRRIRWKDEVPTSSGHFVTPVLVYALRSNSTMSETKALFDKCVEEYKSDGSVSEATLYTFCDAFYYEWKSTIGETVFPADDTLDELPVKQGIRTGALTPVPIFEEDGVGCPDISIAEVAATPKAAATKSTESVFEEFKAGKHVLDYCWDSEQYPYIPSLKKLDEYVPTNEFYLMANVLKHRLSKVVDRLHDGEYGVDAIGSDYINMILTGKPGTGKTTLANMLGATFGLPVHVVTPNKHSEEDLFTGMTKVSDGGFKFVETPFLNAYKNGGIILVEEFNLADPAIMMGVLGQAIVPPFIMYEDGYKEVRRHPLCVIIFTMNTGTQGSREPSEAMVSRCPLTIMLDDPDEATFLEILNKHHPHMNECKRVLKMYGQIQAFLKKVGAGSDVQDMIGTRQCIETLDIWLNVNAFIPVTFRQAIYSTMIGAISTKDKQLADDTYAAVVEPTKD